MIPMIFAGWGLYCYIRIFHEKGNARWGWAALGVVSTSLWKLTEGIAGTSGDKIFSIPLIILTIFGIAQIFNKRDKKYK